MSIKSIRNAIIFCGNTGAGKSYICNRIFETHGVATRFNSSDSVERETGSIQHETINHDGTNFTIVDTPGFFDNYDPGITAQVDGDNMCKLVATLESCQEIFAIVFIFTDRFSTPHSIWFHRIKNLLTPGQAGHIVLLHNKLGPFDLKTYGKNVVKVNQMIGGEGEVEYVWISSGGENSQFQDFLTTVAKLTPFNLSNLVVPDICYERQETGQKYDEVISETTKDEGQMVQQTKDNSHYVTDVKLGDRRYLLFGPREKEHVERWVPSTTTEEIWVPKNVTRRITGTFENIYKVRFDGTKDFLEKRQLETREEVF